VSVPVDGSNLVVKAVRALEPVTGKLPGMRLHLEKRIPHGAGLGGGSSDAAAALRLVREAFCQDLSGGVLQEAAAAVGSDVPFFLLGNVADATGRGEKVVAVPEFTATPRVLLVKLPFGIPTPWAYRQWKDALEVPGLPYRPQATACGELRNDLERPVFEKFQVLGHLKARLLATPGVSAALMSGSGSTVFALLGDSVDLAAVKAAVHDEVGHEVQIIVTRLRTGVHPITVPADFSALPATDVAL
jgi:4-diphosphocytidyl-2-C-methyl-D-erythritol kinase